MRSARKFLMLSTTLLACGIGTSVHAAQVTVAFRAEVTKVVDASGAVGGRINVGDIVDGQYTYDTDAPDSDPSIEGGTYKQLAPYGLSVIINEFQFQSIPAVGYSIGTFDNHFPGKHDFLRVTALKNNFAFSVPNATLNTMSLDFEDDDGTALSSAAMPDSAPLLPAWPRMQQFSLSSSRGGSVPAKFQVEARVLFIETVSSASAM